MRWIVLSEPYSLSSRIDAKQQERRSARSARRRMFSHFYLRQMQAEELYESLLVATEADKTHGSYEEQEKTKADWLQQFTIAFGTDEGDEATTFNGTIPQALMMMNGELVQKATSTEQGQLPARGRRQPQAEHGDKINYLFHAGARPQGRTTAKCGIATSCWSARKGDVVEAPARYVVGGAEQQRVHFESLTK